MEYNIHRMWQRHHQQHNLQRPFIARRLLTVKFYLALTLLLTLQTSTALATTLGAKCQHDMDCTDFIKGSSCSAIGYCECAPYYVQYNTTSCLSSQLLGGDCALNEQCTMKVSNSSCLEGACRCVEGFLQFRKHTCLGPAAPGSVCYSHAHCQMFSEKTHCDFLIPNLFGRCQCTAPAKLKGETCVDNTIAEIEANAPSSSTPVSSSTVITTSSTTQATTPVIVTSAPLIVAQQSGNQQNPQNPSQEAPVISSESQQSSEITNIKPNDSQTLTDPQIVEPQSEEGESGEEEETNVSVEEQTWEDDKDNRITAHTSTSTRVETPTTQQIPFTPAEVPAQTGIIQEDSAQDSSMVTDDYPYKPDYEYNEEHPESKPEKDQESENLDETHLEEAGLDYSSVVDNTMNFDYEAAQEEMEEEQKEQNEAFHKQQELEQDKTEQSQQEVVSVISDEQVDQPSSEQQSMEQASVEQGVEAQQPVVVAAQASEHSEELDQSASEDLSDATTQLLMDEISHDIHHQEDEFVSIDSTEKESEKHENETSTQQQTPEGSQAMEEVITTPPDAIEDTKQTEQENHLEEGEEQSKDQEDLNNRKEGIEINNNIENAEENQQPNEDITGGHIADISDELQQQPHEQQESEHKENVPEESPQQQIDESTDAMPEAIDESSTNDDEHLNETHLEPHSQVELDQTDEDVQHQENVVGLEEEKDKVKDKQESEITNIEPEEDEATTVHNIESSNEDENSANELHNVEHQELQVDLNKNEEQFTAENQEETTENIVEAESQEHLSEGNQNEKSEEPILIHEELNHSANHVEAETATVFNETPLSLKENEEYPGVLKIPAEAAVSHQEEEDSLPISNEIEKLPDSSMHDTSQEDLQSMIKEQEPALNDPLEETVTVDSEKELSSEAESLEQAVVGQEESQANDEVSQENDKPQPSNIESNQTEDDNTETPEAEPENLDSHIQLPSEQIEDQVPEVPDPVYTILPGGESQEHHELEEQEQGHEEDEDNDETIASVTQATLESEGHDDIRNEETIESQEAENQGDQLAHSVPEEEGLLPLSEEAEHSDQDQEDSTSPVSANLISEHLESLTDTPLDVEVVAKDTVAVNEQEEHSIIKLEDSLTENNEVDASVEKSEQKPQETELDNTVAEIPALENKFEMDESQLNSDNEEEDSTNAIEEGNQKLNSNEHLTLENSVKDYGLEEDKDLSEANIENNAEEDLALPLVEDQISLVDQVMTKGDEKESTTESLSAHEENVLPLSHEEPFNQEENKDTVEENEETLDVAVDEKETPLPGDEVHSVDVDNQENLDESDIEFPHSEHFEQNESIMDILNDLMKDDVTAQPEYSLGAGNNLNLANQQSQEEIPDLIASDSTISEEKVKVQQMPLVAQTEPAIDPEDKLITFYPDMQEMQEQIKDHRKEDDTLSTVVEHSSQNVEATTDDKEASGDEKGEEASGDQKLEEPWTVVDKSHNDVSVEPPHTSSPVEHSFDMSGDDLYPHVELQAENLVVETTTASSSINEIYSEETLAQEHPEVTTTPGNIAELTTQTMLNLASRVTLMEPAAPVATTLKPLMSTTANAEIVTPEPQRVQVGAAESLLTTKPTTSEIRKRVELSLEAVSLGLSCSTDKQCQLSDPNTKCNSHGVCDCAYSKVGALQCSADRTGCSPGTFQCRSSGVCISWFFVCDGRPDCNDASDEECSFNARRNQTCPEQAFQCGRSSRCISRAALCDGRKQCPHGDDELGCFPQKSNDACPPHTFRCKSGECLPEYEYCNAIISCRDGSDEPPHLCGSRSMPHFFMELLKAGGLINKSADTNAYCPHRCSNGRCRSTAIVCSGRDGCGDGTDEQTCSVCRCPAVPLDKPVLHVNDFLARHRSLSWW